MNENIFHLSQKIIVKKFVGSVRYSYDVIERRRAPPH